MVPTFMLHSESMSMSTWQGQGESRGPVAAKQPLFRKPDSRIWKKEATNSRYRLPVKKTLCQLGNTWPLVIVVPGP